jgi:hypothetical protein
LGEYLEHVEPFVLYHLSIVLQQFHAQLEMFSAVHVRRHHVVVGSVQQDLPQQFNALSLRNIRIRLDQDIIVSGEKEIEVGGQVAGY